MKNIFNFSLILLLSLQNSYAQFPSLGAVPGGKLVGSAVRGAQSQLNNLADQGFSTFKNQLNKVYSSPEEEKLRKGIFVDNFKKLKDITESATKLPFSLKLNDFADLLNSEYNKLLNGFGKSSKPAEIRTEKGATFTPSSERIPDSIDWRQKGGVSPVKSQELCAGCYAFSAAGALEGQNFRKNGVLKEVSVQNLIDCTEKYGNDGCAGGLMDPAYQYAKDNKGISKNESYPFEAKNGECRYNKENNVMESTGIVSVPTGNEEALKKAVATEGPVSAAIDASLESFQFYSEGIYLDPKCKNDIGSMNHAVLIVGYGTENGKDYWLVKNSYGTKWGMEGYIKMARNANNHCGIATLASYPKI